MHIYLAGAEATDCDGLHNDKAVRRAFCSYYWMKYEFFAAKKAPRFENFKNICANTETVIVDSGAHTFFSEDESIAVDKPDRRSTKTKEQPEEYWQSYLAWLRQNYERLTFFVELDIGEIVGMETVRRWRDEMRAAGIIDKAILCYHPDSEALDSFMDTARTSESRYVACEGFRGYRRRIDYMPILRQCYEWGVRVHGFALVKQKVMDVFPFYSVDSTAWKNGCKYGWNLHGERDGFHGVRLNRPTSEAHRRRLEQMAVDTPEWPSVFKQGEHIEARLRASARQYALMEDHFTRLWDARGVKWEAQLVRTGTVRS